MAIDFLYPDIKNIGFTKFYDFVFNQHPTELKEELIRYGYEFADMVITKKRYRLFDPIVSDCSCQMRTIWLCCFVRSCKSVEDLSLKDLVFFGLARLLCESAVTVQHNIVGAVTLKTQSSYWPDGLPKTCNRVRRYFYGQAKALVAQRVIDDLRMWFKEVPPEKIVTGRVPTDPLKAYEELVHAMEHLKPSYTYSETPLPVLHSFLTMILIMTLAKHFGIVITLLCHQVSRGTGNALTSTSGKMLHFQYDSSTDQFEQKAISEIVDDDGQAHNLPDPGIFPEVVFTGHTWTEPPQPSIDPSDLLASLSSVCGTSLSMIDCIYTILATHDIASQVVRPIDDMPTLNPILQYYIELSKITGLKVSDTVLRIYNAQKDGHIENLCINNTPFEISHIYADALSPLRFPE